VKYTGIVRMLAEAVCKAARFNEPDSVESVVRLLTDHLRESGLTRLTNARGSVTSEAIEFFRTYDMPFRVRRLRLLLRRLTQDWQGGENVSEDLRDHARDVVYNALSRYFDVEPIGMLGHDFPELAANVFVEPEAVLARFAERRRLADIDLAVDEMIAKAMADMPDELKRHMLLAYLGFPFYDTVTLPLLRGEGMTEFDPVKVDRISPDDALSIRRGGTHDTLRGVEFYNFGAFFSRAYRENDYLWGRLHGAERMIDLIVSALPENVTFDTDELAVLKRDAFLAILDEEETRLVADPALVPQIRVEVLAGKG